MFLLDILQNIPLWVVLLGTLAVLLYLYGNQPFREWQDLGVSGPKPSPFMGNVVEMTDIKASVNKWQKSYGRMFGIYMFRTPALVVTDPEVLKEVFVKDFNNFTDRFLMGDLQQPIIDKGVFFTKGSNWKRVRHIMSPIFTGRKLKLLNHFINLTAQRLGENMKKCAIDGKLVNAKNVFGDFVLDAVCGTTFGLDTNASQDCDHSFIKHSKSLLDIPKTLQALIALTGVFPFIGPIFKMLGVGYFKNSDVHFFEKNISALINERKAQKMANKNMDFLQLLMEAESHSGEDFEGEKKLSTEEIAAQGIIFILGAFETTSITLQFLSYELAKNQEVQERMVKEIGEVLGDTAELDYDACKNLRYMDAVINETLRMHPSFNLLSRIAERGTNLKGVPVPAKSVILVPLRNLFRDPEFFHEPDSFRPDRFLNEGKEGMTPFTFLPFGQGPRACIGLRLAKMTIKIALVHMLRSVKLVDAKPDILDIDDSTGTLIPRIPIELHVQEVTHALSQRH